MTRSERACLALALLAGGFVATVELHTTEVTLTIAVLAGSSLILGFVGPRWFWLWGVFLGSSVPGAYLAAAILQITPRELPQPVGIATDIEVGLFTIAVATIASAIGAAAAGTTRSVRPRR